MKLVSYVLSIVMQGKGNIRANFNDGKLKSLAMTVICSKKQKQKTKDLKKFFLLL